METVAAARQAEIDKYVECYLLDSYRMGTRRFRDVSNVIGKLFLGNLLDVGAGRGELQKIADQHGIKYTGVEPVPYLASERVATGIATDLPFDNASFDMVACLDVLEHLVEDDIRPALDEMWRVSREYVLLTASDKSHRVHGVELHISSRPIPEWEALLAATFGGSDIKFLGKIGVSPGWLVRL